MSHGKKLILSLLALLFVVSCSGPQNTEITKKGGGRGDTPDYPDKPTKSKHDSLGQLAVAGADFAEVQLILQSLLKQNLNNDSDRFDCPRRIFEGNNKDESVFYYSIQWDQCGKTHKRTGIDCVAVTTSIPGSRDQESITNIEVNSLKNPVPVRNCDLNSYYVSGNSSVFTESGLTLEIKSKDDTSRTFSMRRDQFLAYQREKQKFELKYTLKVIADVLIPTEPNQAIQYNIQNMSSDLKETQTNADYLDYVKVNPSAEWVMGQQCGFLTGNFLIDITSNRFNEKITDQAVIMSSESVTSPMTNSVIKWSECKSRQRSAVAVMITDFFAKFEISK